MPDVAELQTEKSHATMLLITGGAAAAGGGVAGNFVGRQIETNRISDQQSVIHCAGMVIDLSLAHPWVGDKDHCSATIAQHYGAGSGLELTPDGVIAGTRVPQGQGIIKTSLEQMNGIKANETNLVSAATGFGIFGGVILTATVVKGFDIWRTRRINTAEAKANADASVD